MPMTPPLLSAVVSRLTTVLPVLCARRVCGSHCIVRNELFPARIRLCCKRRCVPSQSCQIYHAFSFPVAFALHSPLMQRVSCVFHVTSSLFHRMKAKGRTLCNIRLFARMRDIHLLCEYLFQSDALSIR